MMNKTISGLAAVAFLSFSISGLLSSCKKTVEEGKADSTMTVKALDEEKDDNILKIDTLKYVKEESNVSVKIRADFPVAGSEALLHSLREFINENLGDAYAGDLSDGDSLVNYYGCLYVDSLKRDIQTNGAPEDSPLTLSSKIIKEYETEKAVTYSVITYQYMGGVHGGTSSVTCTFRKSDGRKFGNDILKDCYSEEFTKTVKEGLKGYFEVTTDEELESSLLDVSVYNIPLPKNPPYFSKTGLTFEYQQYEICPYAFGMPAFVIPYSKAKKFLVRAAAELIP